MHPVKTLRRLTAATALLGSLACSSEPAKIVGPATSGVQNASTTVIVVNDGSVALNNVLIRTSERDELARIPQLNPGQRTGSIGVNAAHSYPYLEATVGGRVIVGHPVEGFSGWNPALPAGAYVLKLRYNGETNMVEPRFEQSLQ